MSLGCQEQPWKAGHRPETDNGGECVTLPSDIIEDTPWWLEISREGSFTVCIVDQKGMVHAAAGYGYGNRPLCNYIIERLCHHS